MLTGTTLGPPTQALPGTPAPKKNFGRPDVQRDQISAPILCSYKLEPSSPPHIPSIQLQLTSDHDSGESSGVPQSGETEDEYTLSAYGDMSLGEIIVPPLPDPMPSGRGPLQPSFPRPRLRLKVQRPPVPKRRLGYYVPDPFPHSGGLDLDERWPGSPRPIENRSPWVHQPLISPFLTDRTSPLTQEPEEVEGFEPRETPRRAVALFALHSTLSTKLTHQRTWPAPRDIRREERCSAEADSAKNI